MQVAALEIGQRDLEVRRHVREEDGYRETLTPIEVRGFQLHICSVRNRPLVLIVTRDIMFGKRTFASYPYGLVPTELLSGESFPFLGVVPSLYKRNQSPTSLKQIHINHLSLQQQRRCPTALSSSIVAQAKCD